MMMVEEEEEEEEEEEVVVVQEASFTRLMIFTLKGSVHPNYTKINKFTLHCPSVESRLLNRSIFIQDVVTAGFKNASFFSHQHKEET